MYFQFVFGANFLVVSIQHAPLLDNFASNYKLLQDSYNQMEKSFVRDEAVLDKRDLQVKKFIMAKLNEDAIVNKAGKELKNVSLTPLVTVANETASIKKLESWIASLDNSGRNFVKSIARKAGRSVNAELHIAAVRMEERTEASGYACQFLLCHPDTQCRDFHRRNVLTSKVTKLE